MFLFPLHNPRLYHQKIFYKFFLNRDDRSQKTPKVYLSEAVYAATAAISTAQDTPLKSQYVTIRTFLMLVFAI